MFPLFGPTSIRWYVWCWQYRKFRKGFKNIHKHMQRRHWSLEYSGASFKELHNALLSHNPNMREAVSNQQGWVFWQWFDMPTFWDDKSQQFGEISSGIKPNVKDLQHLVFRILITTMEKKEQAFCFGSCIWGDKQHTEEKRQTHQKTFMQKKCKSGGKNCVRRRCLFEDW